MWIYKKKRNRRRRRQRRKARSRVLIRVVLVGAILCFCVVLFQMIRLGMGYLEGRTEYDKIRNLATKDQSGIADEKTSDDFQVDFEKLLEINPDTVGWIRFSPEPEEISYPIVQGKDNQEYLSKTFSENSNTLGAIFLHAKNADDFSDVHSILYGHRMKDGSMFRHLQDYEKKEFWGKNPYFYLYTVDGRKLTYQIYSVAQVVDGSESYVTGFSGEADFRRFVEMTKETSIYHTGVDTVEAENVITLSTCTGAGDEHRFVVRGIRIKEERIRKE